MPVDTEAMTSAVSAARAPFDTARPNSPAGSYQVPSEDRANPHVVEQDDISLVTHIRNLFQRSRNYRRPLVARWLKNYEILSNRTWGTRATWLPSPELPEIYPIIASLAGWMTDTAPTFEVQPVAEPNSPFANYFDSLSVDLQTVLKSIWANEEYDAEVEKVVWDAHVYGLGVFKTVWDPTLHNGMGNPKLLRVDPFTFYCDPDATSLDDAAFMFEVRTFSAQEVEKRWPGAMRKLGYSGWTDDIDTAPNTLAESGAGNVPKANPGVITSGAPPAYGNPGQSRAHATDDNGITVIEAWLRVPIEYDRTFPDGSTERASYDGWRCVVVAGNCVLMDEAAEVLAAHGQHPYERYVPHETGEFYGYSLVEMLTPLQLSINRMLAAIEQNMWLTGNPVWKESNRAQVSRQQITNKPGQRVLVQGDINQAGWEMPPQMHPQMSLNTVQFYIGEMERISGLAAINRGVTPTGRNAEGVLGSVQEAAFVRTRMALRNLEWCLRRCGNKVASLVVEYYDAPRFVAIAGPSGERSALALKSHHFYVPKKDVDGRVQLQPMRFQLLVQAGSSLPMSRSARAQEADALYAMQAIDEEAVLEAHDWPNRQLVTARVREQKIAAGTYGLPPGSRASGRR